MRTWRRSSVEFKAEVGTLGDQGPLGGCRAGDQARTALLAICRRKVEGYGVFSEIHPGDFIFWSVPIELSNESRRNRVLFRNRAGAGRQVARACSPIFCGWRTHHICHRVCIGLSPSKNSALWLPAKGLPTVPGQNQGQGRAALSLYPRGLLPHPLSAISTT